MHLCGSHFKGDVVPGWYCVGDYEHLRMGRWRRRGEGRRGGQTGPAGVDCPIMGNAPTPGSTVDASARLPTVQPPDFSALALQFHENAREAGLLAELAVKLGVAETALLRLNVGHLREQWTRQTVTRSGDGQETRGCRLVVAEHAP